ncbi:MAG: DUF721 domain-containing protein [Planctomycetes bacterium]|nr:DUF721 domain-containing protein [Planctomycetota bacterium]
MTAPKHVGDLLKHVLREAGTKASRSRIVIALEAAVGPNLAEHVRVAGFRSGKLVIEVDSSALLAELRGFRSEELRNACNERLDHEKVARIEFRLGGTAHV